MSLAILVYVEHTYFFVEDPVEHTDPKQLIEQGSNGHVNPNSLSNALAI